MLKFCVFEIRSEGKEKGETIRVYVYIGAQESLLLPPSLDLERGERERRER